MVGNSTLLKNSCMALKYTLFKRRCCFLATKKGFVAELCAIGETISLNVSFTVHCCTTPHGRWNWSWLSVSLLVTVMTSKDYDYQGLVGILLIIQLQRGLLVMDWLPSLFSLSGRSHPTEARRPHFLFSGCVDALFSELGTPHSGRGLIYSPTFEVQRNRWSSPRDKQEMGVTGALHTSVNSRLLLPGWKWF